MTSLPLQWQTRTEPLAPLAVAARGVVAAALARRLLDASEAELSALAGVGGPHTIILVGAQLPWVDGVVYLGRDAAAPALLLPTARAPSVRVELLERAVLARRLPGGTPFALGEDFVASVGAARAVTRAELERWLGREGASS